MVENSASSWGQAARIASVSGRAVQAGVRSALADGRSERASVLRAALGGIKGPLMKVAQILGTIPDLVPPDYAAEFAELQANAPPMGIPFVRRRMAGELGDSWRARFLEFDETASFAASLGQVHRARGLDGRLVACKLQYPNMASAVEADLGQLKAFFRIYELMDRAVDTRLVQEEIAERLREEIDYRREAWHISLFREMLKGERQIHLPEVVSDLSTDRLLTMTWLEGETFISGAERRTQEARNDLARLLHRAWYVPFCECGIIHGDPHFGNYTITPENELNLLDFGCVRVFTPELVGGVLMLYRALLSGDEAMAVEAYRVWGFQNPTKELVSILNVWARFVYAPLLEDSSRPLEETNTGVYGKETARRVHAALRKVGGVTVPKAFVFMDRAAVGLGSVFLRLHARVNWYRLFNEIIENVDVETVRNRQAAVLSAGR